jgi:hypothetical protein
MALFSAYFDESGTHQDSPVMVILGLIATNEQWKHLKREWDELLIQFELLPPFHMKEYAHSTGQFKAWKGAPIRDRFLSRIVGIILRRVQYSVAVSLSMPDYNKVIAPNPKASLFFGSPYAMCIYQTLFLLDLWWKKLPHERDKIPCIFDSGHPKSSEVSRIVRKYSSHPNMEKKALESVSFVPDDDHPPLQAADLVAWELCKATREGRVRRRSFERLREVPHEWIHMGTEALGFIGSHPDFAMPTIKVI